MSNPGYGAATTTAPRASAEISGHDRFETASYVEWATVWAGAMAALAVSFLLLTFGSAVGLASVSPWTTTSSSATAVTIGAGLWLLLVNTWAFALGGYLAGRMRHKRSGATPTEVNFRDGAHGALVWSTAVVIGAIMAVSASMSVLSGGAQAVGSAASGLTSVATDQLLRTNKLGDGSIGDLRAELGRLLATQTGRTPMTSPDRTYLVDLVAARTGIPAAEAEKRVDATITQLKDATNKARKAAIVLGFMTAATLLLGGAAAWWGASVGGRHRDQGEVWAGFASHRH